VKRLEKEIDKLNKKKQNIHDLTIEGTFDEDTYKGQIEKVNQDLIIRKLELNENKIEFDNAESCINYCKFFLRSMTDLWKNANLNLKQRFQRLIFPKKIYYKKGRFRTTKTALIFKHLEAKSSQDYCLAPPIGNAWNFLLG
jgi:hypothetical protein